MFLLDFWFGTSCDYHTKLTLAQLSPAAWVGGMGQSILDVYDTPSSVNCQLGHSDAVKPMT